MSESKGYSLCGAVLAVSLAVVALGADVSAPPATNASPPVASTATQVVAATALSMLSALGVTQLVAAATSNEPAEQASGTSTQNTESANADTNGYSLVEVMDMISAQNLDVMLAVQRTHEANGNYVVARAGLLPQVNGTVSETRQDRSTAAYGLPDQAVLSVPQPVPFNIHYGNLPDNLIQRFNLPTKGNVDFSQPTDLALAFADTTGPFDIFTAKLMLNAPIVNFKQLEQVRAASENEKKADFDVLTTIENSRFQSANVYLTLLLCKAGVKALQDKVTYSQQRVSLVSDMVKTGVKTDLDLQQQVVSLGQAQQQLAETQWELAQAYQQLRHNLDLGENDPLEASDTLEYVPISVLPFPEALEISRTTRPDYLSQKRQEAAAQHQRDSARDAYLPTVSAIGTYGLQGNEPNDNVDVWSIGAAVQMPIWDSFKRNGQLEQKQSLFLEQRNRTADLELQMAEDLKAAASELSYRALTYLVTEQSVAYTENEVTFKEHGEAAGTATHLDVLSAQVDLAQAKYARIEAIFNHSMARAKWYKALGNVREVAEAPSTNAPAPPLGGPAASGNP